MSVKDKKYLKAYVSNGVATYCHEHCEPYIECEAKIKVEDYWVDVEINDEPKAKFELTAEEVEIVENSLKGLKTMLVNTYCSVPEIEPSLRESRIRVDNLLTRIKQWQDGNK